MKWLICKGLALRFDPRMADGLDATITLRVRQGRRVQAFTIAIAQRACRVTLGEAGPAGATASVHLADMLRLGAGSVGWPELLSSGRLEMTGDPFLALRFPSLFRLPARSSRAAVRMSV